MGVPDNYIGPLPPVFRQPLAWIKYLNGSSLDEVNRADGATGAGGRERLAAFDKFWYSEAKDGKERCSALVPVEFLKGYEAGIPKMMRDWKYISPR